MMISSRLFLPTAHRLLRPKAVHRYLSNGKRIEVDFQDPADPQPVRVLSRTLKEQLDPKDFTVPIEIKMPALGGGGKIVTWYRNVGDIVQYEDVICDIETKEFTFGLAIDDEEYGIVHEIMFQNPSEIVKDDEIICIIMHQEKKKKSDTTTVEETAAETTLAAAAETSKETDSAEAVDSSSKQPQS
jgi:hypothetical protein